MFFIALLIATTVAIAGAAAYFSVYGMAYTFSGVFWSVVAMGASLEAGKLIAASYLYRYWNKTNVLLKSYLIFGVAALMLLTSVGIFGYLSSGYQQDVLPLKQKTEQVQLLEEEKVRVLQRKNQIDNLMAGSATVTSVTGDKGIDRRALMALRETTRARESLVKQYKAEQAEVTQRIKELDAQLLTMKQELIQVEAHIGPITYIAKAFNFPTDDATKYLIFIIIFAFDPMAVALTLAVNTALRLRREEKDAQIAALRASSAAANQPVDDGVPKIVSNIINAEPLPNDMETVLRDNLWDLYTSDEPTTEIEPIEWSTTRDPELEPDPEPASDHVPVEATPEAAPVVDQNEGELGVGSRRRVRPYANLWSPDQTQSKLAELVNHYQYLMDKIQSGQVLSKDEQWELSAVKDVLQKSGYSQYL